MMRRRQVVAGGWLLPAAAAARLPWRVRMASTGEGGKRTRLSTESHQGFIGAMGAEWQDINSTKSKGDYQWPMADKIDGMGSSLVNLSKKVRYALRQIDRCLDLFEPGQLAIAFNGGKDSTAVMHLVQEACERHPTHKFTHIQPIWFQHTGKEFTEVAEFVQRTSADYLTYRGGLKTPDGEDVNRMWVVQANTSKEFNEAMAQISITTGIRALLISSRRSDPGCRDLSQMALLDLNPVFLSHTVTRIEIEEDTQKKVSSPAHQRGLPLGILDGSGKRVVQPSILRFSPILEWTQRDVWDFILATEVPYCSLYDKGYTAIGMKGETLTNPFLVRDHPTGFCSVFAGKADLDRNCSLERIIGADKAQPLVASIEELFQGLGVAIFSQNPVELRNQQAVEAMNSNSAYAPAWMLKDEKLEGFSSVHAAQKLSAARNSLSDSLSPFDKQVKQVEDDQTAAVLLVGEEWMSGAQREECSNFLADKLHSQGIKVRQILTVENDVDVAAFMIWRLNAAHKYLFVVGGIGAAYGDISMAAMAKAFGTGVILEPSLLKPIIASAPKDGLTEYHLRMAYTPYASEIIGTPPSDDECGRGWRRMLMAWPVIKKNNCYLLPSSIAALEGRFKDNLSPLMRTTPFKSTTIKIQLCPANVSSLLLQAQDEFPLVTFDQAASTVGGQTEDIGIDLVKVAQVRLESKEHGLLKDATQRVIDVFGDYVVSVESDVDRG